jgi:hypothetical protein
MMVKTRFWKEPLVHFLAIGVGQALQSDRVQTDPHDHTGAGLHLAHMVHALSASERKHLQRVVKMWRLQ